MLIRKLKEGPVSDSDGVKGACPLGLLPPLGERGGHPRNFHAREKKREWISTMPKYQYLSAFQKPKNSSNTRNPIINASMRTITIHMLR
jgi:hypothetical protein